MPERESYYHGKTESLRDLFGAARVAVHVDRIEVDDVTYPVIDDVIILVPPEHRTERIRALLGDRISGPRSPRGGDFDAGIRDSFGDEWRRYREILPEHRAEFERYFDLVDLGSLAGGRVCDLGCGMGRWSRFLTGRVGELVLVDFSEAVFTARDNLRDAPDCLFFMADLTRLPFRDDFADFVFCLGVLHHLPVPALEEVRRLRRFAPLLLVFLYYALDNRPWHYRLLLKPVSAARKVLSKVRGRRLRKAVAVAGTWLVYRPLIGLGRLLRPLGWSSHVPLYDFYHDRSPARIEQDVYDRFFTGIEQRVTREEILGLRDSFSEVVVSDGLPYWHFLCRK
jgi:SAM-dependent methyltransferase